MKNLQRHSSNSLFKLLLLCLQSKQCSQFNPQQQYQQSQSQRQSTPL
jgi:hypothetical protein